MFSKKGVIRNFTKFTGKLLCQSLFFNKVSGLKPYQKMRLWHRFFPVDFVKLLRTPLLTKHLRWLPLENICTLQMTEQKYSAKNFFVCQRRFFKNLQLSTVICFLSIHCLTSIFIILQIYNSDINFIFRY